MTKYTLTDLGWSARFLSQLTTEEAQSPRVARITTIARDRVFALSPDGPLTLETPPGEPTRAYATGDWVTLDATRHRVDRRLERATCLIRGGAEGVGLPQLIAANVDTLGIVTSCNADFNEARLERYLALAASAGVLPLIILTKSDLSDDPRDYARRAERLSPLATAIALDATAADAPEALKPWASAGQTLALLGSSGVGKTTLSNGLTGADAATAGIREDDAKGRHTTTSRGLYRTQFGGWLIDTPGMRALPLTDATDGIEAVFSDIEALASGCRFSDCAHDAEPGCAIKAAVAAGELDPDRLRRFQKLLREDAHNTASTAEARARDRALHKMYRGAQTARTRKGR